MGTILKISGLWLTLIFWSALSIAGDTTEIRKQVLKVAKQIAKYKTVDNSAVGFAGLRSDQYKRFDFLVQQATENELVFLTDHENSKVRAYAFWALAKRNYKDIKALLDKHLTDTAAFEFYAGCMQSPERVNNFMLNILTPNQVDPFCYKLSKQEIFSYYNKMKVATKTPMN